MNTTRKRFLFFAAALAWLFCGLFAQTALAALLPASHFHGVPNCVVSAPKPAAAHSCCAAMEKIAASTRAMHCSMESASQGADVHTANPAAPMPLSCRCEAPSAPFHSPLPSAPNSTQKLRASSDDEREHAVSPSSPFALTFSPAVSLATPRAVLRRLERDTKPRSRSSSPPLPGRAPPVFA
jgi:hypothetical protein